MSSIRTSYMLRKCTFSELEPKQLNSNASDITENMFVYRKGGVSVDTGVQYHLSYCTTMLYLGQANIIS